MYNSTFYKGTTIYCSNLKQQSVSYYTLSDKTIIAIFQGNRGDRPDLDFVVKYLSPGLKKKLRTPSHTHWIVDLLIKFEVNPVITSDFVMYFLELYDSIEPFQSIEERNNYDRITIEYVYKNFGEIDHKGGFTLEFLATLIELFIKCEKRTKDAFMFKGLLRMMADYCEGKKDFYQVVAMSKRV